MKLKLKLSTLLIVIMFILSGCSNNNGGNTSDNLNEGDKIEENLDEDKVTENEDNSNDELSDKDDELVDEEVVDENEDTNKDEEIVNQESEFIIYTRSVDDTDQIVEFKSVNLNKNDSIEKNINELISILKNDYFKDDKIDIKLESIEDGIATINLVDKQAWHPHFQGSTGGYISQMTIIETLLQKDYDGQWINGVDVIIDGKKEEVFDHAPFTDTFYR